MWGGLEYIAFNDNPPTAEGAADSEHVDADLTGHTKGYIAWSTDAGYGFWLTHSSPQFPLTPRKWLQLTSQNDVLEFKLVLTLLSTTSSPTMPLDSDCISLHVCRTSFKLPRPRRQLMDVQPTLHVHFIYNG
jgi:hypothetical protein